jgi:threonine dehydratase
MHRESELGNTEINVDVQVHVQVDDQVQVRPQGILLAFRKGRRRSCGAVTFFLESGVMVTFEDVASAAQRIAGIAHRTPVATSRLLDEACGNQMFLKCENLQRVGAFKFRGAYNAISRLPDADRVRGVVSYSSGNHAQAVALVCQILRIQATIVMPSTAPDAKLAAVRAYGAEIVLHDPETTSREEIARALAARKGSTVIPPFDHPDIIAGQGTAALELFESVGQFDYLFVPCGGGGLISGSALAARRMAPGCKVVGVEPEAGDDATRSFRTGTLQSVHNPDTIADGARTPSLGKLTFPLIRQNVDDMTTVTDEDLIRAMHFVWSRLKLVVEPTGVLGLAAVFNHRYPVSGRRVGVILSGGNVDLKLGDSRRNSQISG